MAKICFVSYEIHPTTPGGCGVLLYHSARHLLEQGHEIIFLLDIDDKTFNQFNLVDRLKFPNPANCRAYKVTGLLASANIPHNLFKTWFEYRDYIFYVAAREVYRLEKPDTFEFFEYCGAAYYALSAKAAGLDFQDTHLAVRLHNSLELIDREQPDNLHGLDRYIMFGLEHQALRLAESVLYPSKEFLEEIYQKIYEPWFGNLVLSQPALTDFPQASGESENADGILFFGRLFGFKGIDRFVDAAVLYLSSPENPPRRFLFVGYDSLRPPTSHNRYQDYLLSKVPEKFQDKFVFLGQMSWQKLGALLPQVLFAVIPSYLESFCYAAHELYEAGIPLIAADIPAFKASFQHESNALLFDGTVSDLARQISRLSSDARLREKIRKPYAIDREPLGDFYQTYPKQSWIRASAGATSGELLVCILGEDPSRFQATLESIQAASIEKLRIVAVRPVDGKAQKSGADQSASLWIFGQQVVFQELDGQFLAPTSLRTGDALIFLKAGDLVDRNYLVHALGILERQEQAAFVGCWQKDSEGGLDTLPYDSILEAMPYLHRSGLYRFVMRTPPGQLLIDLFDSRSGPLGELAYLWQLEDRGLCGIMIPEVWLEREKDQANLLAQPYLDYLLIRDDNPVRQKKLARLHLSLRSRKDVLTHYFVVNRQTSSFHAWIVRVVHALATSRVSKWADQHPGLKNAVRSLVARILSLVMRGPKGKSV